MRFGMEIYAGNAVVEFGVFDYGFFEEERSFAVNCFYFSLFFEDLE